jgi:hypothetical protein
MMVAVTSKGRSFRALAAYVFRQKNPAEQDAVAWAVVRNLPTDNAELAVTFMTATAAQSARVEKPTYHIVVSFAPDDPVDRALMEQVGDRVLAGLGLAEHQAMIVAHRDRPHPHMHIILNRIHPESGRVWNKWYDWRRVRQVVAEEERRLGLRPGPMGPTKLDGLARDLETLERHGHLSGEHYHAQMEASAARAREVRLDLALERALSTRMRCDRAFAAVYRDPARAYYEYTLTARTQGPVVAAQLMRERPEEFGTLATVERARAFGLWRVHDKGPARSALPAAAVAAREAYEAARAWGVVTQSTAQRAQHAFEQELGGIYEEPAAAHAAFERLAGERGAEKAAATLRERPEAFGKLRPADAHYKGLVADQVERAATRGVEAVKARGVANGAVRGPRAAVALTLHRTDTERAVGRVLAVRAELAKLPKRPNLERRLKVALGQLLPQEARRLGATIGAPSFSLVSQLGRKIRDLVLNHEEEREHSR